MHVMYVGPVGVGNTCGVNDLEIKWAYIPQDDRKIYLIYLFLLQTIQNFGITGLKSGNRPSLAYVRAFPDYTSEVILNE